MFIRKTACIIAGSLALSACQAPAPAAPDTATLTIERVFASPSLNGPAPQSLTFSPDGSRVTFLRAREDDLTVLDLWAMDAAGGEPYRLVDSQVLAPDERELTEAERQLRERARISSTGIVRYDWDALGEAILVPLDGDVFRVDIATGEARRLTQTEAYETDARISPQGHFVSFIREQNLVVLDLATGTEQAVTTDGGSLISWGMAEFIAQEELGRSTGYWWSPDERYIAIARVDESPVDNIDRLEIAGDGSSTIVTQRYPRAGTENAVVELFLADLQTGTLTPIDLPYAGDNYLARVDWSHSSDRVFAQVLNRRQKRLRIITATPASGERAVWMTEQSDVWINLSDDFRALADGSAIWTSEDTPGGFRHIQHRDADGTLISQVTSGDWVVDGIAAVDEAQGLVYFTGWMETPLRRDLYVVPIDGSWIPTRITGGDGRWSVTVNRDASAFIGTYSDPATPPQTALYDMDGNRLRWIEENRLDDSHPYGTFASDHIEPQFGTIEAEDGSTLHYEVFLPADFDPSHRYPAVQYVYGGPHVQRVSRGWQDLRAQLFARRGYVYFMIDGRGSSNRGRDFEAPIARNMGSIEVADQLAGLAWLKSQPYVDPDHVGMWGWSYGGYMTLMTTLQAPGSYAAGIAGAPVTDWALYDTAYTERYMGDPRINGRHYERSSVFTYLENYETPLLLVHGMADDNVTFANSVRLYNALQDQGSQFEMMTYPGQRHGVRGEGRQVHLWHTMFDFLDRELKP
jgi:dipeptidyl-peptidase-4